MKRMRVLRAACLVLASTCSLTEGLAQSPPPLSHPKLDLRIHGQVRAIVRQPDGGVVFGGRFDWVDGSPRSNLARLLPDGSLDPDWNPATNDLVRALATDSNGAVYVGGDFSVIGGEYRRMARLSAGGPATLDATWNPSPNSPVFAIAVDAGGAVYVAGTFTQVGGQPRNYIAKLSGSGTGAADTSWNPSANGRVEALALDGSGSVYVGGYFTNIGGQPRNYIARLSDGGSGAADATWNPTATYAVGALAVDAGGAAVYAAGGFTNIGGQTRNYLAKLSAGGAGAADSDWDPSPNGPPSALALDAGGAVYAVGSFSSIGGESRNRLAKLSGSGTGSADAGWNPSADSYVLALASVGDGVLYVGGEFTEIGGQARQALSRIEATGDAGAATDVEKAGTVYALARQAGGGMIVGGSFASANGEVRHNLLRVDAAGILDPDWSPEPDGIVRALAVGADDAVFAGGQFYAIGGESRQLLAKLSGTGVGAADALWDPKPNSDVYALAVDAGGFVYAGGAFSAIGGQPRNNIARLSDTGVGAADASWNPSANGNVKTLVVGSDGVYAGGQFTNIGGQPRNFIARLSVTGAGAADFTWNPTATATVNAIALDAGGAVYAGGEFANIGGQTRQYIAKLSSTGSGTADADWNPSANSYVYALAVDEDATVYAGGNFSVIGGQARYFLARLSDATTGAADAFWNPFPDGRIFALAFDGVGSVHAGGEFRNVGGTARVSLVALPPFERLFYDTFE